jgi:hypothetical protein
LGSRHRDGIEDALPALRADSPLDRLRVAEPAMAYAAVASRAEYLASGDAPGDIVDAFLLTTAPRLSGLCGGFAASRGASMFGASYGSPDGVVRVAVGVVQAAVRVPADVVKLGCPRD